MKKNNSLIHDLGFTRAVAEACIILFILCLATVIWMFNPTEGFFNYFMILSTFILTMALFFGVMQVINARTAYYESRRSN